VPNLNEPHEEPLRLFACYLDETPHWTMTKWPNPKPDRIEATYVFSPDVGVYLCSITPATALWFVSQDPVWDGEVDDDTRELVTEAVSDSGSEIVTHQDRRDLLRSCPGLAEFVERIGDDLPENGCVEERLEEGRNWVYLGACAVGEDLDEACRDAVENFSANPCW